MEETVVRGSKFYRSISYNCQQDLRGRSNELYVSPCNLVSDFSANLRVFEIRLTRNFDKDIVQSEPQGRSRKTSIGVIPLNLKVALSMAKDFTLLINRMRKSHWCHLIPMVVC